MLEAPALLLLLHPQRLTPLFFFFFSPRKAAERMHGPNLGQGLAGILSPFHSLPQWTQPVGEARQTRAQQTWVQGLSLPPVGCVTSRACHYLICTVRTESSNLPGK